MNSSTWRTAVIPPMAVNARARWDAIAREEVRRVGERDAFAIRASVGVIQSNSARLSPRRLPFYTLHSIAGFSGRRTSSERSDASRLSSLLTSTKRVASAGPTMSEITTL